MSAAHIAELELPIRITLVGPPAGVEFCIQRGRAELFAPKLSNGEDLSFDFSLRAAPGSPPRLLGPFTQGPPAQRFVYVRSGTLAGQAESRWTRRAKVPLGGITRAVIEKASRTASGRLEARIQGSAKDGGPACASVDLLDDGWRVVR